jgi:hypothetical protein
MRAVLIVGEYALGLLVAIVFLLCLLIGLLTGFFEVPRYLKISGK